jgi:hypothetical protein
MAEKAFSLEEARAGARGSSQGAIEFGTAIGKPT